MIRRTLMISLFFAPIIAARALAAESAITIDDAWARPSLGAGGASAVYFILHNKGKEPDTLTRVTTPAATNAALHETRIENGVAKMLPVQSVEIPAGGSFAFAPKGPHVMLMGLTAPLKVGDSIALTLHFKNDGAHTITVPVREPAHTEPKPSTDSMGGMKMDGMDTSH